jgi:tRNA(His) 5'-end guanylyltransferase
MKARELDKRMRPYERAHDIRVPPGVFMVARIDGRGFHRFTREVLGLRTAADEELREHMVAVAEHVMSCGFRSVFAYTQSDEVNLLLHRDDATFQRRLSKLHSVLAGEASACFSARMGKAAAFDCRISQLASPDLVVDYFRWRQEDATRNALNARVYWMLREAKDAEAATKTLEGLSHAAKHERLFQEGGVNFNDLPAWERRGLGVRWAEVAVAGEDPRSGEATTSTRRRLVVDRELPMKADWEAYLRERLVEAGA